MPKFPVLHRSQKLQMSIDMLIWKFDDFICVPFLPLRLFLFLTDTPRSRHILPNVEVRKKYEQWHHVAEKELRTIKQTTQKGIWVYHNTLCSDWVTLHTPPNPSDAIVGFRSLDLQELRGVAYATPHTVTSSEWHHPSDIIRVTSSKWHHPSDIIQVTLVYNHHPATSSFIAQMFEFRPICAFLPPHIIHTPTFSISLSIRNDHWLTNDH